MSAHPDAFKGLAIKLCRTKDPLVIDELLDKWNEWKNLATEHDAGEWGFDDKWMADERVKLSKNPKNRPSDAPTS